MTVGRIQLFPGWALAIAKAKDAGAPEVLDQLLPIDPAYFSSGVTVVADGGSARIMAQFAEERPVCHVGWDVEFRYNRPPVTISPHSRVFDPRSIQPLLLSLAIAEKAAGGLQLARFVVDLRVAGIRSAVQQVLNLPVPFVGHYSYGDLHCLWQLRLQEPRFLWDTWVAEKVRTLGSMSRRRIATSTAHESSEDDSPVRLDLASTCARHRVPFEAADKSRLQHSFLEATGEGAFTEEQIKYAAADAEAVCRLYLPQVLQAAQCSNLPRLHSIEMPWVVANARVAWHGVRIDPQTQQEVRNACDAILPQLEARLADAGLMNWRSHKQLVSFFSGQKLLHLFKDADGYTFDKSRLKELRGRHPVIDLIYEARRIQALSSDKILWTQLTGADGRVHADHRQLGCASGRQSCRWPNLLGLDRRLRPLIVPESGNGIGEVDLSQIEVGIAAAVYRDHSLVEMFNVGDVYVNMAKSFYEKHLSEDDLSLTWQQFKKQHPEKRDVMKTLTLGVIYGLTPYGIANRMGVPEVEGKRLLDAFMAMFPAMKHALEDVVRQSVQRGYAVTATGLKRYRKTSAAVSSRDRNWMRNHPVQGTAADLFKAACIRLDRLYMPLKARLILPVHDAVVFECPLSVLTQVADLTRRVLCEAVQEHFPELRPRAEINIARPECWNKDGQAGALIDWIAQATSTSVSRNEGVYDESALSAESLHQGDSPPGHV